MQKKMRSIQKLKREVRILGIDDCPFDKFKDKTCKVIGVVFRGASFLDGLISFDVTVDGNDATDKIIKSVKKSRHYGQLGIIMIDGIALAGFNVVDIHRLSATLKLPIIVVTRKKPDIENIKRILSRLDKRKVELIEDAGQPVEFIEQNKRIYFQYSGISEDIAKNILSMTCIHGLIPEPIRIAHLIASGISLGDSHGRA